MFCDFLSIFYSAHYKIQKQSSKYIDICAVSFNLPACLPACLPRLRRNKQEGKQEELQTKL